MAGEAAARAHPGRAGDPALGSPDPGEAEPVVTGGSSWLTGLRTFRSLGTRNYRLYAAGQVVSNTGTWMQRVAQDWLVLQLTHGSGTALGIATGLQFAPQLLFSLWGGIIADRYPKRSILLATQALMGMLALVLGVLALTGLVRVWQVYLLAFALGMVSVVDNPTRQTFAAEMVGRDGVANAIALNSATFNLARITGPAVAGLVISAVGTPVAFLLNAASYGAVLAGLKLMRPSELHQVDRPPRARGQLREALRYVRARPSLWVTMGLVFFVATFGMNFQVTTALMSREVFHTGAGAFGLASTMYAVGALGGALLAARRSRPGMRLLIGSGLAFGALEVVTGLMPGFWSFLLTLVPTGLVLLMFTTTANSATQLSSTASVRG
ncbi:MAG: MFS transporter, partial [Nocardiopsaceae bacterium]|nr:MFS transporter [Nocardiopsaceae bacterium]